MLTPQEVSNSIFEKAVFGGYDISAVDRFLAQVSKDYTTLFKENEALKAKLKTLSDKVTEYRATEDAMRLALLNAKKTAKEITDRAETEREALQAELAERRGGLLVEAERSAAERREELSAELAREEAALARARSVTGSYLEKFRAATAACEAALMELYGGAAPAAGENTITEPELKSLNDMLEQSFSSGGTVEKPAAAEDSFLDFGVLNFGTDRT